MRARVVVGMLILVLATLPVLAQPMATESLSATGLSISSGVSFDEAVLRVSGPNGYGLNQRFEAGAPIVVDLVSDAEIAVPGKAKRQAQAVEGISVLPDGRYKFEAVFSAGGKKVGAHSGTFFVEGGLAVSREAKRDQIGGLRDDLLSQARAAQPMVESSAGFEVAGQSSSTETDISFDKIWITDDVNDGRTELTMDSDLPIDSQYWTMGNVGGDLGFYEGSTSSAVSRVTIERGGQVGIGTTTPDTFSRLHVRGATSGLIVLDEADTTTPMWVGPFDGNFLIQGISGASFFVINDDTGNVGLGINPAEASLHVADADAQILVDASGSATGRTLAYMKNNGDVRMFWENKTSGDIWQMSMLSTVLQMSSPTGVGKFRVRKSGGLQALNGSTEIMALNSTGDLTVKSVTQTSSREQKLGFESVDAVSVLEKVAGLPISEWSYRADNPSVRHLGPMSEDFHAAFGLGKTDKGLTSVDTSGVALAAIQGLNQKLEEKDARIGELEHRLLELEELVQALAEH